MDNVKSKSPHRMKKASWKKHRDAPSRPLSAYNLFFADTRAKIMVDRDGATGGFKYLGKTVGALWKGITETEKQPYIEKANESKEKYCLLLKEWEQTTEGKNVANARKERERLTRKQNRQARMCKAIDPQPNVPADLLNDYPLKDDVQQNFDWNETNTTSTPFASRYHFSADCESLGSSSWSDSCNYSCNTEPAVLYNTTPFRHDGMQSHLTEMPLCPNHDSPKASNEIIAYNHQHLWDETAIWNAYFPSSSKKRMSI
jgi:HMG (high mobility group) box